MLAQDCGVHYAHRQVQMHFNACSFVIGHLASSCRGVNVEEEAGVLLDSGVLAARACCSGCSHSDGTLVLVWLKWDYGDPCCSCRESLIALGLDYLDLYLIHWPVTPHKGPTLEPPLDVSCCKSQCFITMHAQTSPVKLCCAILLTHVSISICMMEL